MKKICTWIMAIAVFSYGLPCLALPAGSSSREFSAAIFGCEDSLRREMAYDDLDSGMEFTVRLLGQLDTRTSKKGDQVLAEVTAPQRFQGAVMEGVIQEAKSGGSINGTSILTFTFEKLIYRGDETLISSSIRSFTNSKGKEMVDEEGNVVKKKDNRGAIVAGALLGAAIGAGAGGVKGAAAGAGIGVLATIITIKFSVKGTHMSFATGSQFLVEAKRRKDR